MNVIDDDLIRRLCDELDGLTAGVAARPPDLDVDAHVVGTARAWSRRRLAVLIAAALLLILGAVGALIVRNDRGAVGSDESTVASTLPVTTASLVPAVVASPTTQPPPTTTSVARQDIPYLAVGESVMLGAKPAMEASGIKTIAEVSKSAGWELEQVRAAKSHYDIKNGVVVQLGTNGTVTREQYEAVLAELPPEEFPLVVVMTVKADKPWIARNNEIIRSLPATHPNVEVLDWEARSEEIADHLSSGDGGVHLGDDVAKAFFRDVILEAMGVPT